MFEDQRRPLKLQEEDVRGVAERGWTVRVQITQTQGVFIFLYTRHGGLCVESGMLCALGAVEARKRIEARSKQGAQGLRGCPRAARWQTGLNGERRGRHRDLGQCCR